MNHQLAYLIWQLAQQRYQTTPQQLTTTQLNTLTQQAQQALHIQQAVLAAQTMAHRPDKHTLEQYQQHVFGEQQGIAQQWFKQHNLTWQTSIAAMEAELAFHHAVQQHCEQQLHSFQPSEATLQQFYQQHPERFTQPAQKLIWHLLITINADFVENRAAVVWQRMQHWHKLLRETPEKFAVLAERYSECPSALQQGKIGWVSQGQLQPALEPAFNKLSAQTLSPIIESELGLHLLWCEAERPAQQHNFESVKSSLSQHLIQQQRKSIEKTYIQNCLARYTTEADAF